MIILVIHDEKDIKYYLKNKNAINITLKNSKVDRTKSHS